MGRVHAGKDVATGLGLSTELDKERRQKAVDTLLSLISKVAIKICQGSNVCINVGLDVMND
jgi:hypothetical protein